MTCYCGQEFTPTQGARLRCPLCAVSKVPQRRAFKRLDYLASRSHEETALVLKLPLKLVLTAEAAGLAKLRELGRRAIAPTFGGRTLPPDLRATLRTFERVRDKLAENGCEQEAREVQEIIDTLEARVREITERWAAESGPTLDDKSHTRNASLIGESRLRPSRVHRTAMETPHPTSP